jgi:hypothetical protein
MSGKDKLVLYVAAKPEYDSRQVSFIVKAVAGAHLNGIALEIKSDADLDDKGRAVLVPFVHVPTTDLLLLNDEGLLKYYCSLRI